MHELDGRLIIHDNCNLGVHHGPKPIKVQQIIGERDEQKSITIHIRVPRSKPAIEQIVDVFVRRVRINNVRVLTDKVIVCGEFEVKAIYVACKPNQPVHGVEAKPVRFTVDVCIPGVRCGMDADAEVYVEYVDYESCENTRAHWYKQNYDKHDYNNAHDDCCHKDKHCHKDNHCEPDYCPPHGECTREFDVFVVLRICVKVYADREIIIYPQYPQYHGLPAKPKG